jgi:hypothetical protein
MKIKISKSIKYSLLTLSAIICLLILSLQARTAIQQVAGLAVAQSSLTWNNVIDAIAGDAQPKGIMGVNGYLWNGTSFDRSRGDTTNGLWVNIKAGGSTSASILETLANAASTGVGTGINLGYLYSKHTWIIVVTGAPTSSVINIEGSINSTTGSDGTWGVLDISNTGTSEMRHIADKPVVWLRANIVSFTGGTTPKATIKSISGGN